MQCERGSMNSERDTRHSRHEIRNFESNKTEFSGRQPARTRARDTRGLCDGNGCRYIKFFRGPRLPPPIPLHFLDRRPPPSSDSLLFRASGRRSDFSNRIRIDGAISGSQPRIFTRPERRNEWDGRLWGTSGLWDRIKSGVCLC